MANQQITQEMLDKKLAKNVKLSSKIKAADEFIEQQKNDIDILQQKYKADVAALNMRLEQAHRADEVTKVDENELYKQLRDCIETFTKLVDRLERGEKKKPGARTSVAAAAMKAELITAVEQGECGEKDREALLDQIEAGRFVEAVPGEDDETSKPDH